MNELAVSLPCECGRTVVARATDAGGTVWCQCGRPVLVPNLSRLREMSGAAAYVTNPAEAIRKAQREGRDPGGENCLICKSAHPVRYECTAICEKSQRKAATEDGEVSVFLSFPLVLSIPISRSQELPDREGHDIEVIFALPVCDACGRHQGNVTRPRVARRIMRLVPLYAELLSYYPKLKLTVSR